MEDDKFLDRTKDLPEDFYSTTSFTDKLLEYLQAREGSDQPFFAYLPFTAPHWPLQAPPATIEKYRGFYDDGPEALRLKRLQRLMELGLIAEDVEPAPMTQESSWTTLSAEERFKSARKMEVFAAMVDIVDQNIKRVTDYLTLIDELDNTFVLFMSDNGAEGALLEALPVMGGASSVTAIIEKYYNNSIENMGMADSYIWYGPDWACASMAPSRGFKTWITEGGIRCPCVVRYPPLTKLLEANAHTDSFSTVMDILPTILDLAGIPPCGTRFRNREVVPVRGSSWVPHLSGATDNFHDKEDYITGWELFGFRAIRQGSWKALYMQAPRGKDKWELYNVAEDPGEVYDLAEREPKILEKLVAHWETYYAETGMFDPGQEFPMVKI